jgi:membrane associated rhomboid family serine protease
MTRPGPPSLRACAGSAILFGLLSAVFLIEIASGAVGNDARLLMLGALPDSGGLHGQYWRLLSFGLLHSNLTHLLLNSVLLLIAGPAVERRAGARWLFAIFLTASVASGIGILVKHGLWPAPGVSVGASGGMFGLLAAALVLMLRAGGGNSFGRAVLGVTLVAGLAYSALPGISMTGHLIGLAVGAAAAFWVSTGSTSKK